ncbi:hypothetical protein HDU79_000078 [Rhizoclosmatium sp. JEL0117]|nr:hypothetical protein HDU79_000078 [Rhizoclosmatium sp. JEL0117]
MGNTAQSSGFLQAHSHQPKYRVVLLYALVIATAVMTIWISSASVTSKKQQTQKPDSAIIPRQQTMDIVISYYEESLERLNLCIDLFRRDERVARRKTRLFIYSKSRKYTLEYIQNTTQADVVVRLPNHGREGHSYFTHIVKYYDSDLADHTLFMQADPEFWVTGRKGNESMHEHTFNRLKYLSDKTGYMPFAQSFGRNFGGGEGGDFPHLRDIFVLARGYFPSRNRIQTSWKGQFIGYNKPVKQIVSSADTKTFDIVISHYEENIHNLTTSIDKIRRHSQFKDRVIRTFVYTKSNDTDRLALKKNTEAYRVILLPNVGREGHTYLDHIETYFNDLADHTLFMQAEPSYWHKFNAESQLSSVVSNRIQHFSDKTGFMDLGFVFLRPFAGDKDGYFPLLKYLFSMVAFEFPHVPIKSVMASYNGQFIVSRKRIQQSPKKLYVYLKRLLEAPEDDFIHKDQQFRGWESSPDDPVFGHTIERAWSVLFDCWNAKRIALCSNGDEKENEKVVPPYPGSFGLPRTLRNLLLAIIFGLLYFSVTNLFSRTPTVVGVHPTRLPGQTNRTFDIVVSHYEEDIQNLTIAIDKIRLHPKFKDLNINLFVYTKSEKVDRVALQRTTGATVVTLLPNVGREGHTYMHHIVSEYNNLADHTLFMQAEPVWWTNGTEPHFHAIVQNRIQHFRPESTGYMDLSVVLRKPFVNGEGGEFKMIPFILTMAQDRFLLNDELEFMSSWKGQFIVSRKRIQAVRRKVYAYFKSMLEVPVGHPLHDEKYYWSMESTPDNPAFGHTLER